MKKPAFLAVAGFSFVRVSKLSFFDYDLVDSVKDWRAEWFYAANLIPSLVVHSGSGPMVNDRWDKKLESPTEIQVIQPLLDRISMLKIAGFDRLRYCFELSSSPSSAFERAGAPWLRVFWGRGSFTHGPSS